MFNDIFMVGTGGSSSRLAAHRAAKLKGDPLPSAKAKNPAKATPSAQRVAAPKPAPPAPTAKQIEHARRRARHDAVMSSPQAKGRQAAAASLLGCAPHLSTAQIIAALPTMPTDAQAIENGKRARIAAMWGHAYDRVQGKTPAVQETAASNIWDKAIALNNPNNMN
ncbi:MAG: hypothetical protein AB7E24_14690 [Novosphingobium sp.]